MIQNLSKSFNVKHFQENVSYRHKLSSTISRLQVMTNPNRGLKQLNWDWFWCQAVRSDSLFIMDFQIDPAVDLARIPYSILAPIPQLVWEIFEKLAANRPTQTDLGRFRSGIWMTIGHVSWFPSSPWSFNGTASVEIHFVVFLMNEVDVPQRIPSWTEQGCCTALRFHSKLDLTEK